MTGRAPPETSAGKRSLAEEVESLRAELDRARPKSRPALDNPLAPSVPPADPWAEGRLPGTAAPLADGRSLVMPGEPVPETAAETQQEAGPEQGRGRHDRRNDGKQGFAAPQAESPAPALVQDAGSPPEGEPSQPPSNLRAAQERDPEADMAAQGARAPEPARARFRPFLVYAAVATSIALLFPLVLFAQYGANRKPAVPGALPPVSPRIAADAGAVAAPPEGKRPAAPTASESANEEAPAPADEIQDENKEKNIAPGAGDAAKIRALIVDRSIVIGQALACRLDETRVRQVMERHTMSVEELTAKDPALSKLSREMVRIAREDEEKLGAPRCDLIEAAFSGLEAALPARNN